MIIDRCGGFFYAFEEVTNVGNYILFRSFLNTYGSVLSKINSDEVLIYAD